ncbi:helix-turn-helix domain-containing protein [Promicromonospora sp. NPDC050249]|uniref:helix-turn-helix domain-containing protein n=1 Tax=Promicromonospora sp. NPDC050249 TaxID=3154743 RepID=UPI0034033E33
MSLSINISAADLAGTRFAISPLAETISGLQQLARSGADPRTRWWVEWARERLAVQPLRLATAWPLLVTDRLAWPQFLLPAPATTNTSIEDDLAAMQRTTPREVGESLNRVFGDDLPPAARELAEAPEEQLAMIAAELRDAHDHLVRPHWPRIRALLETDIAHRATQLASGGAVRLFEDLHSDLVWSDGRLTVLTDQRGGSAAAARGGLVLLPVTLGPDRVIVKRNTTTQTTVRYPCRGVGRLALSLDRSPVPRDTARLLGRSKAGLLRALLSPATTTDLARELGTTPSAVAQHLGVLRANGLVRGRRHGRRVLYETTALGRALLAGTTPT